MLRCKPIRALFPYVFFRFIIFYYVNHVGNCYICGMENKKKHFEAVVSMKYHLLSLGFVSILEEDKYCNDVQMFSGWEFMSKTIGKDRRTVLFCDYNTATGFFNQSYKYFSRIEVIIIDFHSSAEQVKKFLRLGVKGFLSLADRSETITEAIQEILEGDVYMCKDVRNILAELFLKGDNLNNNSLTKIDLTEREVEVLSLTAQDYTNTEIAEKLFISKRTVESHRGNIISKMSVRGTAGMIVKAIKEGMIDIT